MFPANFSGTQGTPTMTWGSNGNVGIGTTAPERLLHLNSSAVTQKALYIKCAAGWNDNLIEIDSGTQAASSARELLSFFTSNRTVLSFYIRGDGNVYNANGVYGSSSDLNLKENIENARSYSADLRKLNVVKYSLKSEKSDVPTKIGLIAQEVELVFPGLVEDDPLGNKQVKTSVLTFLMLKTIQELIDHNTETEVNLSAENTTLKQNLSDMNNRMALFEARLAALETS